MTKSLDIKAPDFSLYPRRLVAASRRLLDLVDRDPDSPTWGCFDYHFWRSKTSPYANARLQEAAYTLALLYRESFPGNIWQGRLEILELARGALKFWAGRQHPDGSFDEWYLGEHGYAATAFSSFAAARAYCLLKGDFPESEKKFLVATFKKAGHWLSHHRDLAKLNHEAVGAAALYALSFTLKNPELQAVARQKVKTVLALQDQEGWFPELGGMDSGYSFLTLEYLAQCWKMDRENQLGQALCRCLNFLSCLVQPDLTTGREYNLCGNSYVSLLGAALLGEISPLALRLFREGAARPEMALKQLAQDDLSSCYHLYNGLLSWQAYEQIPEPLKKQELPPLFCFGPPTRRDFPRAGIMTVRGDDYFALCSYLYGGVVKIYAPDGLWLVRGWRLNLKNGSRVVSWLRGSVSVPAPDEELAIRSSLRCPTYFFPGTFSRLILSLLSCLPGGYRLIKQGMDWLRRKKSASLQLSSVSGQDSGWILERKVLFSPDLIEIEDRLAGKSFLDGGVVELVRFREGIMVERPFQSCLKEWHKRFSSGLEVSCRVRVKIEGKQSFLEFDSPGKDEL